MAGVLVIKPLSAKLTRDTEFFGKMDPYCVARLGRTTQKTAVAKKAGKLPFWRDQLVFRKNTEEEVVFEVWDSDTATSDDLVGETRIILKEIGTEPWEDWLTLKYRGKTAGKLRVNIEFTPEQPLKRSSRSNTPAKLRSKVGQEEDKRPVRATTAPDIKKRPSRGSADHEEERRPARPTTAPDGKKRSRGSDDQEDERKPTRANAGQADDQRRTRRRAEKPSVVETSQEKRKPARVIVSPEDENKPPSADLDKQRKPSRRITGQDDGHTQSSRMIPPKPPVKSKDPCLPPPLPFYLQPRPPKEVSTTCEIGIQASPDSDNSSTPSPIKSRPNTLVKRSRRIDY
jgi:hypothetical protein